jgi:hypothetical protein
MEGLNLRQGRLRSPFLFFKRTGIKGLVVEGQKKDKK